MDIESDSDSMDILDLHPSHITSEQAEESVKWEFRSIASFGDREEVDDTVQPSASVNVATGVRLCAKLDGNPTNTHWTSTCDVKIYYPNGGVDDASHFFLTNSDPNFLMPSNLFSYTVKWTMKVTEKQTMKRVVSSTFEPMPLTMRLILETINRLKVLNSSWSNKEVQMAEVEYDDFVMQQIKLVDLDGNTTSVLESPKDSEIKKSELLKRLMNIGLKRYITTDIVVYSMWEEYTRARFVYGEKFLLCVLMPESLMRLLQIFRDKQFYKLAFRDIVNPEYKGIRYIMEENTIGNVFRFGLRAPISTELKELNYQEICSLYQSHEVTQMHEQMESVLVYRGMLERSEETKSIVSYKDELVADRAYSKTFKNNDIEHAINFLIDNRIIVDQGGAYLTMRDHIDDLAIANVFKYVLNRKKNCRKIHDFNLATICCKIASESNPPIKICDEQMKVIECLDKNRLVGISGAAGSGKSKLIWLIIKALARIRQMMNELANKKGATSDAWSKQETFLVTSFQSANVTAFQGEDILCFTMHRLLFLHEKHCPKSPFRSLDSKDECIFEHVSSVFIEECGLVIPALLSRLLVAVKQCGKLKRILFCGDKNQNKSIAAGNLIDDLRDSLYTRQLWFDFIHDHRTSKEAAVLGKISVNIANGVDIVADGEYYKEEIISPLKWGFKNEDLDVIVDLVWNYIEKNKISEYSHLVITREHKVRSYVSDQLSYRFAKKRDPNVEPSPNGFYIGNKVVPKGNDYDRELKTNQLLVLHRIYDKGAFLIEPLNSFMFPYQAYYGVKQYGHPCAREGRIGIERTYELIPLEEMNSHVSGKNLKFRDVKRIEASYEIIDKKIPGPRLMSASVSTINSAQGNELSHIILILPYDSNDYDTRNSLYTGVTRAKDTLFIIHTVRNLKQIINRPEKERHTNLVATLENVLNDMNIKPKIEYVEFSLRGRQGQEKKITEKVRSGLNPSSLLMMLKKRKEPCTLKSIEPDAEMPDLDGDSNDNNLLKNKKKQNEELKNTQTDNSYCDIIPVEIWTTVLIDFAKIEDYEVFRVIRLVCKKFNNIVASRIFCSNLADSLIEPFKKTIALPYHPHEFVDGVLCIPGTKIVYCKSCKSALSVKSIASSSHKRDFGVQYSVDYNIPINFYNDGRVANPSIMCNHYITTNNDKGHVTLRTLDTDTEIIDLGVFKDGFIECGKIKLITE